MTEYERMIRLLDTSWVVRDQIVPCLVGPPGIGKTAAVMQHAKAHDARVTKIVASRCVPSETVGMTMPDHENRSMAIYNSLQLSSLRDGDILFLDELLEADQFVLSTLLTVIESREMADGTPLPDIQIIAATNDTISPEQLKGNIRQRFMFQRFKVDAVQTKRYIRDKTGMDIPSSITSKLCENGNDYNFLTPRSLTKLAAWVMSVPTEKIEDVAQIINEMWSSTLGSELAQARRHMDNSPEAQVRRVVKQMLSDSETTENTPENFDDCTMGEMLEILQGLPEWKEIESRLADLEIEEAEEDVEISF